jgi:hypothetical protein
MRWVKGDIWIYHKLGKIIVIPTNAGWKSDGSNVMGRGLAKQASEKFPELPFRYGDCCKRLEPHQYFKDCHLILIPSKKLNEQQPYLSWQHESDKDTIITSLAWLQIHVKEFEGDKIYVPILGAGNGGMQKGLIKEIMDKYLTDSKFIGVEF